MVWRRMARYPWRVAAAIVALTTAAGATLAIPNGLRHVIDRGFGAQGGNIEAEFNTLFMIVGVAGFSILAIFTMIVSEKYRDIGILKSLGASNRGVMTIFVSYGLLLGAVGCGLGTALGLTITDNINGIEAFLTQLSGKALFPRDVYYFKDIPTNIDPVSVALRTSTELPAADASGSFMSVMRALVFSPAPLATSTRLFASVRASSISAMNAPEPVFTSSTRPCSPAASFFDRIEAVMSGTDSTVAVTSRMA